MPWCFLLALVTVGEIFMVAVIRRSLTDVKGSQNSGSLITISLTKRDHASFQLLHCTGHKDSRFMLVGGTKLCPIKPTPTWLEKVLTYVKN